MVQEESSPSPTAEGPSFHDRYTIIRDLGSGHFAVVRLCVERVTGVEFAAKCIRKRRQTFSRRGAAKEDIQNEIAILRSTQHDHIIHLHQVFEDEQEVILVLELVRGGELFHYLSERDHLSEEDASRFVQQILGGVEHLHEQHIAHLDLKPENILLSSADKHIIKIIDFGLAKRLHPGTSHDIKSMQGTAEFVAPEVVNYEPLSLQTDLWSLGVIAYMLLSGTSPFAGANQQETFANITSAEFDFDEENFANTSDLAKDFIRSLLRRDPKKRLTAKQALEHAWIRPRSTQQMVTRKASNINVSRLKAFSAKRRWKESLRVIKLCNRLSKGTPNRPNSTASILSIDSSFDGLIDSDTNANFVTKAVFCAIEDENIQGLERLLNLATVEINCSNDAGQTAAHVAAGAGRLRILQMMYNTHRLCLSKCDAFGDTPLHWAARQDRRAVVEYLLQCGVDANATNSNQETALFQAVRYGHQSLINPLIHSMDAGAVNLSNSEGDTCLHSAANYTSFRCLQTLLQHSILDRSALNSRKETALHICASQGGVRCVELLVKSGTDCNLTNSSGFVALVCSLRNGHKDVSWLLMTHTKLNVSDREGNSVLHHAVETGEESLVEYLISKQPDLARKQSFTGSTPLHQAARHGQLEIARLLCSTSGADVETLDFQGLSPQVLAFLNGHKDTGNFLQLLADCAFRQRMLGELLAQTGCHLDKFSMRIMGHARVGKTSLVRALQTTAIGNLVQRGSALFRRRKSVPCKSASMANLAQMRHGYPLFTLTTIPLHPQLHAACFDLSSDPLCLQLYSHVIGYSTCLYVVLFSLNDSPQTQREQVSFWLRLLSLSVPSTEPVGYAGKSPNSPLVLLIATHADTVKCNKNSAGFLTNPWAFALVETMKRHFGSELTILPSVFVVDNGTKNAANVAGLKGFLGTVGRQLRTRQHASSIALHKLIDRLAVWRESILLVSFDEWIKLLQTEINPLITTKHAHVFIEQLVFMGEILTVKEKGQMILAPHTLFNQLVMPFLYGQLQLKNGAHVFRSRDLHFIFSNYWHNTLEVVKALEVLGTCWLSGSGDGSVYAFPLFVDRSSSSLPPPRLTNSNLTIRVRIPDLPCFAVLVLPRILATLLQHSSPPLQATIMLRSLMFGDSLLLVWDGQDESIVISSNGDKSANVPLLQDICSALDAAIADILPSALVEFTCFNDGQPVVFGQLDELSADDLSMALLCRICRLLDPKHSVGMDWCLLAVKLGLYERLLPRLAKVNSSAPSESTTYLLLKEWQMDAPASIGRLLEELESIERKDVAQTIRTFLPLHKLLFANCDVNSPSLPSPASPSDKTLSSMSSLALSR